MKKNIATTEDAKMSEQGKAEEREEKRVMEVPHLHFYVFPLIPPPLLFADLQPRRSDDVGHLKPRARTKVKKRKDD